MRMGSRRLGCSARYFRRSDRRLTRTRFIRTRVNWDWDFRTCRMQFQIIARRMDRRRRTCASAGCGQWRTFIMRLRFSRSRMNWRMRRGRIPWNTRWRYWGRIALCRNRNCRRITRITAEITSSIRSIRHASNASHSLRRTKPGGGKRKTGTDLGWASRCTAAF